MCAKGAMVGLLMSLACLAGCDATPKPEPGAGPQSVDDRPVATRKIVRTVVSFAGETSNLPPTAVVYVFARTPGTSMPIAVEKFSPDHLPVEVGFSEPRTGIDTIEIVARLSLSGEVYRHEGDMEIVSSRVEFSATPLSLRLIIPNATNSFVPNDRSAHLDVAVSVADQMVGQVPNETPVFVVVRETSGLPVAVKKVIFADLPTTIRLTDAQSMFRTNKLSHHREVSVVARVALSGQPIASTGDWEGEVSSVRPAELTGPVSVQIDKVHP